MTEEQNTLSNELLDQLQKIPYLLRRAHHDARHRMFKDEARQDAHWHAHHTHGAHHHGFPDGMDGHGRTDWHDRDGEADGRDKADWSERGGGGERDNRHGRPDGRRSGARGQARLLRLLLERDGILMKDIVEELDIRPSSASELVAKLEKRDLVRTETDASDKRAKRVYTTEKTRGYSEQLKTSHGKMAAEVLSGLSEQEQRQLLTLLKKIAASFETRPANSSTDSSANSSADSSADNPISSDTAENASE
jgi:DNA-binding MarR family transcriptional regulator